MRFKVIFLIVSSLGVFPSFSWAFAGTWAELQEKCRQHWEALPREIWNGETEPKGISKFVLTSRAIATQPRFAFRKFRNSAEKHLKRHGTEWHTVEEAYSYGQHSGQSLYPIRSAIHVISYRGELYIVDGHHRALLSAYIGSPMIPVRIDDDWSELSRDEFIKRMEEEALVYVHDREGIAKFYNICEMTDDPNLYLARVITRNVRWDAGLNRVEKSDGAEKFLIVKIDRGVTRQEFDVADDLTSAGIYYQDRWGDNVPTAVLRKASSVLRKAEWGQDDPRILIFDKPQSMTDDELSKLIRRHRKTCEKDLSNAK